MTVDGRRFVMYDGTLDRPAVWRHVRAHLAAQGGPARRVAAFYRGYGGTTCAIGCMIPPERYTPRLEWKAVDDPAVQLAAFGCELTPQDTEFALRLQELHDSGAFWDAPETVTLFVSQWSLDDERGIPPRA